MVKVPKEMLKRISNFLKELELHGGYPWRCAVCERFECSHTEECELGKLINILKQYN